MEYLVDYFNSLVSIVLEMSPYILLGFLLAGFLKVFVPAKLFSQHLGKSNLSSVVKAAIFGVPLPLCSCGVIPTGVSLKKNGASDGATVSFLISTPQTGLDSIAVTWSMLGWPFAIFRPVVAFVTGVVGGLITNLAARKYDSKVIEKVEVGELKFESKSPKFTSRIVEMLRYSFVDFLADIAKWLVVGILLAAFIDVIVPDNFLSKFTGIWAIEFLMVLLISVPMYVCATGSVPLAAVLVLKGLSPGAAFIFLMAGPATNVATITVLYKTLGLRKLLIYLATIILGAVTAGFIINFFFPESWVNTMACVNEHHHESYFAKAISITSAIVLTILLFYSFYKSYFMNTTFSLPKDTILRVEGMSCQHCEANVVRNLKNIEGINEVKANHITNEVVVSGKIDDIGEVEKIINSIGYSFKGIK